MNHRSPIPAVLPTALVLLLLFVASIHGQDGGVVDEQAGVPVLDDAAINEAMQVMVDALYARKDATHHWDPPRWTSADGSKYQRGGYTALAVLALLHAGQSYQDPQLADAVEALASMDMEGTYAVAIRAHVWAMLPSRFHANLKSDAQWLMDGFAREAASWTYSQNPRTRRVDNSLRHYAMLGLWEAAKRGVEVPDDLWARVEHAFVECQRSDGGWNYDADSDPTTGSMTTAGLTALFITRDMLHRSDYVKLNDTPDQRAEEAIERGLKWMQQRFTADSNPGDGAHFFYYLYGVERVGLASGLSYFGDHDWFRAGAAAIIERICNVDADTGELVVDKRISTRALSFGLMFLSRGRVPVAVNKLRIDGMRWNNRPHDVATLVNDLSDATEEAMTWQIVDFEQPPIQWCSAPMLYLASDEGLPCMQDRSRDAKAFRRDVKTYLEQRAAGEPDASPPAPPLIPELESFKRYLDLGGLLFVVDEGRARKLGRSIEEATWIMYPQYEWRTLPRDHWAYTILPDRAKRLPLRGLSNGVRELIINCSADISADLQRNVSSRNGLDAALAKVFYYASEKNTLRPRLDTPGSADIAVVPVADRCVIERLVHDGHWKPEPLALESFARHVSTLSGASIGLDVRDVTTAAGVSKDAHLLYVSGVNDEQLEDATLDAIEAAARRGVIVFFETVGGDGTFADDALAQLALRLGADVAPLMQHSLLTGADLNIPNDCTQIAYRPFTHELRGTRESIARIKLATITSESGGPAAQAFASNADISHALLDQARWGIDGYTTSSARSLMLNLVQWSMNQAAGKN